MPRTVTKDRWQLNEAHTVVYISKSKWPDLWSKWPIFDLVFYDIEMPPESNPIGFTLSLNGPFKWGTVQTSTSIGKGVMKDQS